MPVHTLALCVTQRAGTVSFELCAEVGEAVLVGFTLFDLGQGVLRPERRRRVILIGVHCGKIRFDTILRELAVLVRRRLPEATASEERQKDAA